MADLCNLFFTAKRHKLDAAEIAARTFAESKQTTDRLAQTFGRTRQTDDIAVDDFAGLRADLARQFVWSEVSAARSRLPCSA